MGSENIMEESSENTTVVDSDTSMDVLVADDSTLDSSTSSSLDFDDDTDDSDDSDDSDEMDEIDEIDDSDDEDAILFAFLYMAYELGK